MISCINFQPRKNRSLWPQLISRYLALAIIAQSPHFFTDTGCPWLSHSREQLNPLTESIINRSAWPIFRMPCPVDLSVAAVLTQCASLKPWLCFQPDGVKSIGATHMCVTSLQRFGIQDPSPPKALFTRVLKVPTSTSPSTSAFQPACFRRQSCLQTSNVSRLSPNV